MVINNYVQFVVIRLKINKSEMLLVFKNESIMTYGMQWPFIMLLAITITPAKASSAVGCISLQNIT